jgi:hypothetical protein
MASPLEEMRAPRTFPPEIFVYAVLEFWKDRREEAKSISIQEILRQHGSPGRVFKISENRAFDLLMQVEHWERKPFTSSDSKRKIHPVVGEAFHGGTGST